MTGSSSAETCLVAKKKERKNAGPALDMHNKKAHVVYGGRSVTSQKKR